MSRLSRDCRCPQVGAFIVELFLKFVGFGCKEFWLGSLPEPEVFFIFMFVNLNGQWRAMICSTICMYLIFFSVSDSEKGKDGSWNAFDFFVVFVGMVDLTMDYVSEKLGLCSFCKFCFAACR